MKLPTKIEWTHYTFNPWIGCTKVSPACQFCYAEALDKKRMSKTLGEATSENPISHWGKGAPRHRTTDKYWNEFRVLDRKAAKENVRFRVFCASLADVFDEEIPREWREDLFDLIAECQNLDFQLLTKRPQLIRSLLAELYYEDGKKKEGDHPGFEPVNRLLMNGEPIANVWFGTTVEDQANANFRLRHLAAIPALVRFVSCEPLLGPVTLIHAERNPRGYVNYLEGRKYNTMPEMPATRGTPGEAVGMIHQVIVGGESGDNGLEIRPMNPDWARSIRAQCEVSKTHFFFKQWGGWFPTSHIKYFEGTDADIIARWGFQGDTDASSIVRVSLTASKQKVPNVLDGRKHLAVPLYTPVEYPPKPDKVPLAPASA